MRLFVLIAATAATITSSADDRKPEDKEERMTLLGVLGEWQYPGSKMLDGATMQDGGNPALPSTFCHAILTTPDPIEKVVAFYSRAPIGERSNAAPTPKKTAKLTDAACVLVQDDSKGRPTAVKVIVINKADSSTTLVVSRGDGERATHIAWSHHRRFSPRR